MLKKHLAALLLALIVMAVLAPVAQAKPEFFARIPANYEKSCNLCHTAPPTLNDFGREFRAAGFNFEELERITGSKAAAQPEASKATALQLIVPEKASRGDRLELQARLQDATGKPVTGATVGFYVPTTLFMKGDMFISEALTGNDGVAKIRYTPRMEEGNGITATFKGGNGYQPAEARTNLTLLGSTPQYRTDWGMNIPLLGPWLMFFVAALVWAAYAVVYGQLFAIRRLGLVEAHVEEEKREGKAAAG